MYKINIVRFYITVLFLIFWIAFSVNAQSSTDNILDENKSLKEDSSAEQVRVNNSSTNKKSSQNNNQERLRRFEIGGHYTGMFQDDFETEDVVFKDFGFDDAAFIDRRYESGFGGRFTYNINRNLAIEGEVNFTPSTRTSTEFAQAGIIRTGPLSGGEKTQFLGGVKYGIRRNKYGVFGKIRPGAIRFNAFQVVQARAIIRLPSGEPEDIFLITTEKPSTFFNVDVGGVFEYYPTKRTIFRVDVGDTIIRYNAQEPKDINPSFTRHNIQINVGIGFRF